MQASCESSTVTDFFARFENVALSFLLLDYDGTLAPFHTDRFQAVPYAGVLPLLDRILRSGKTDISIVSGRPIREVQGLLKPLSGFEIWGAHGMEHLSATNEYKQARIAPDTVAVLREAEEWLREAELFAFAEIKPGGIAVHWRGLDAVEAKDIREQLHKDWQKFDGAAGVKFLKFDGGIELRAARPDKGDAIAAILQRAHADTPVAFLGDDLTDEDAFRVLKGRGLPVLVRDEYRPTAAEAWLRPPDELLKFFELWAKAASSR